MGRIELPDVARDEDAQTSRRGGIRTSEYRDRAAALEHEHLVDIAEAAFVVANALERLAGSRPAHPTTLAGLASTLKAGLRGSG